jgi:glycosyltransferase involved in cell wall biosynthesis
MHPLVSVVTPSFNQAQFIEETLRSVELQRYRPIHQIVIDGGSTDGTVELLKRWERSDHGPGYAFEWISERDCGTPDALNKGFERARGEVVGWLNSDDVYFDRDTIGTSVAALDAHPEVDVVHGEVALISEDSGLQMIWCMPRFDYARALRGYLIPQPTVFFRRCVTEKYRFDPAIKLAFDLIYWLKIGREHKFLKIHRIQAGDRDHKGRLTHVENKPLMEITAKVRAANGAKEKPSPIESFQDLLLRGALRIKGLLYVLSLLGRRGAISELAFPVWIDSMPRLLRRQLTMRLGKRSAMGARGRPAS